MQRDGGADAHEYGQYVNVGLGAPNNVVARTQINGAEIFLVSDNGLDQPLMRKPLPALGTDDRGGLRARSRTVDLSIAGFNLTNSRHAEFAVVSGGEEISRSFIAEARVTF